MTKALLPILLFLGFLSYGQIQFREPAFLTPRGAGDQILQGDVDGDGDIDIVFSTSTFPGVYALLNTGGKLSEVPVTVTEFPNAIPYGYYKQPFAFANFDSDAKNEIAIYDNVSTNSTSRISIFKFVSGAFIKINQLPTPDATASSLVYTDYNKDSLVDFLFTAGQLYELEGTDGTNFTLKTISIPDFYPVEVIATDINKDTWPDIVLNDQNFKILILKNNAGAPPQVSTTIAASGPIKKVLIDDFSNDGKVDIITETQTQTYLDYFKQQNNGTFSNSPIELGGSTVSGITAFDENLDGKTDLFVNIYVTSPTTTVGTLTLTNNGTGFTGSFFADRWLVAQEMIGAELVKGEKKDLVVMNLTQSVVVLRKSTNSFERRQNIAIRYANYGTAIGDINSDGYVDIVSADGIGGSVTVIRGKKGGEFEDPQFFNTGVYPMSVGIGDVNNDGKKDIIYTSSAYDGSGTIICGDNGNLDFGPPIIGYQGNQISIADFDNDGNTDFSTGYYASFGNGDGTFNATQLPGNSFWSTASADFNSDSFDDLVLASSSGLTFFHGNSSKTMDFVLNLPTSKIPSRVTSKDINKDGKIDLVCANTDRSITVLLNKGSTTFEEIPVNISNVTGGISFADFDGDGAFELVAAINSENPGLSILKGQNNQYSESTFIPTPGNYYGDVLVADLNKDNAPDVLAFGNGTRVGIFINVTALEPSIASSSIEVSNVTDKSAQIYVVPGNGKAQLVAVRKSSDSNTQPIDGTVYTPSPSFGSGSDLGSSNFVVSSSANNEIIITGLEENTAYTVTVYEYNSKADGTNINYLTTTFTSKSFETKKSQTISPASIPDKILGDAPFSVSTTSSSGLPVVLVAASANITVTGTSVKMNGPGPATIRLEQPGNASYVAASPVEVTFCVNPPIPSVVYEAIDSDTYKLTSSSQVNNQWQKNGIDIIGSNDQTLSTLADAAYRVKVDFNGCSSVSDPVQTQSITFAPVADKTEDGPNFQLEATSSANLPVSFEFLSGPIQISGSSVSIKGAGPVKVQARQNGNASFFPANPVDKAFCINPKKPTISVDSNGLGEFTLTSSSNSNNQWLLNGSPIANATSPIYTPVADGVYTVKVDISGCFSTSDPTENLITGIELLKTIQIFPNPVSRYLHVMIPTGITNSLIPTIYNQVGQSINVPLQYQTDQIVFDFQTMNDGIYFLRIPSQDGIRILKILKTK